MIFQELPKDLKNIIKLYTLQLEEFDMNEKDKSIKDDLIKRLSNKLNITNVKWEDVILYNLSKDNKIKLIDSVKNGSIALTEFSITRNPFTNYKSIHSALLNIAYTLAIQEKQYKLIEFLKNLGG